MAAIRFTVPLSTVEYAIKTIERDDFDQAAVPCAYHKIDRQLVGRLQNQINNMGILYKAMYETHKDRLKINGKDEEYSSFGLDRYVQNSFARFRSEYRAISDDWPLDWRLIAAAEKDPQVGWLSSYIRNSDAHNSTFVQYREGRLGVTLSNSRVRTISNFECWMPVKDYVRLLAHSSKDHIDKCKLCRGFIECPIDASTKLKNFLQTW